LFLGAAPRRGPVKNGGEGFAQGLRFLEGWRKGKLTLEELPLFSVQVGPRQAQGPQAAFERLVLFGHPARLEAFEFRLAQVISGSTLQLGNRKPSMTRRTVGNTSCAAWR
jgi:hypothetical protein